MIPNTRYTSRSGEISNGAKRIRTVTIVFFLSVLGIYAAGCGNKFLDPTQIGRFRPVPAVNVILDSLGVAEEAPSTWEGAEEPRPIDVMAYERDYILGAGDTIRISIFELRQEGVAFTNDYVITETGKISIPEVGVVEAAGLSELQLEEEIKQILSPSILKEPLVAITLLGSQQRVFSISGNGIPRPDRYPIPKNDFRLLDALAVAGGVSQFNTSYIYVSRSVTGKEAITEPTEPEEAEQLIAPELEMLEIIAPRAQWRLPPSLVPARRGHSEGLVISSAEMITDEELVKVALPEGFEPLSDGEAGERIGEDKKGRIEWIFQDGRWIPIQIGSAILLRQNEAAGAIEAEPPGRETIKSPINEVEVGRIEWIFQDGRWVPIQVGQPKPAVKVEPLKAMVPEEFKWDEIWAGGVQTRLIRIDADRLRGGDPRYNIVIRPGDSIQVPVDIIGEFCIMGNVNAQGFIVLTGRPMTLKMAIAAAGGLGPLAWPKCCEVVRRISKNKEEIVMVNLDKIARGEQPDFFIKPNDMINVGTHPTARWRAVLRNAFRATYGFGFIYDRNFADRDYGTSRPIPNWF